MDLARKSENGLFSVTLVPASCLGSQNHIYTEGLSTPFQYPQHMWREDEENPTVIH